MVYKFKLVSDEVTNFSRTIEIDSISNFLQLRNAILDSVGYSRDEMNSFFICNEDWEKEVEITLEDMGSNSDCDIYIMADTQLDELLEDEGQKLIFEFDYLTERSFFMELKEIIPGKNLSEPICTMKMGTPPPQNVDLDEFDSAIDAKAATNAVEELDSDLFGDAGYNEDEIAEGFDDLTF